MVGLQVEFYWYQIGAASFLHAFFSTVCFRLEQGNWGSKFPRLMIQWQFSGKDIFVSYNDDAPAFEMKSDRIYLRDFEGDHYEIDYDGKLIQTLKHEKRRWTAWAHAISRYLKNHFNISHG